MANYQLRAVMALVAALGAAGALASGCGSSQGGGAPATDGSADGSGEDDAGGSDATPAPDASAPDGSEGADAPAVDAANDATVDGMPEPDGATEAQGTDGPVADAPGADAPAGEGSTGNDAAGSDGPSVMDAPGPIDAWYGPEATVDDAGAYAMCGLSNEQVACTQTCNTAPLLSLAFSTASPPAATGGSLAAGVYYMTSITLYVPADAGTVTSTATTRQTAVVSAANPTGVLEIVRSDYDEPSLSTAYEYTPAGGNLDVTSTCPYVAQYQIAYTAAGTSFDLFVPQDGSLDGAYLADEHFTLEIADEGGAPPSDAGGGSDASCGAADAQGACNALCNDATATSVVAVATPAPHTWNGGTIEDGTYYLVSKTEYDGPDSGADGGAVATIQETLVVTTTNGVAVWQDVQSVAGGPGVTSTSSVYAEDATLLVTGACPTATQATYEYTFSGSEIYLFTPAGTGPATLAVYAHL
jgi:hypothetical protein